MKKTSLLVALPTVALCGLLLSGCGAFRSHASWEEAQQKSPLEIPPALDRPSTSDALTIPPPGGNQPTANGAVASVPGAEIADGFVLADSVDNAYRRVGQVLESGTLGAVVGHNDDAHQYTVTVSAASAEEKKGFFGRMFGGKDTTATGDAPKGALHQVLVSIAASGTSASEIRAQGNAAAVAKVIDTLKSRLGG